MPTWFLRMPGPTWEPVGDEVRLLPPAEQLLDAAAPLRRATTLIVQAAGWSPAAVLAGLEAIDRRFPDPAIRVSRVVRVEMDAPPPAWFLAWTQGRVGLWWPLRGRERLAREAEGEKLNEGILRPAPEGVAVHDADGLRADQLGTGIRVGVVEHGWADDHPDLEEADIECTGDGRFEVTDHGTETLGVLAMQVNGQYGEGIVPRGTFGIASPLRGSASRPDSDGIATAILEAAAFARDGGIVLVEEGFQGVYQFPVERALECFAAIRLATDKGTIVVEPAGNSSEPLDDVCPELLSRDSGAILVGGLESTSCEHARWHRRAATAYGQRVDCSAHGVDVYTTIRSGGTRVYGGTSSASAIVAGVVALLGEHRLVKGLEWNPEKARELLRSGRYSTPVCGGAAAGLGGGLPDLAKLRTAP